MNVTVENLGPCKKLLRFELEPGTVDTAFGEVAKEYQKQASLPGFRAGKAPKDMILKRFEKEITDEAKRKLIGDSYRNALKEHHIEVVGYPDVEEIHFAKSEPMQFAVTVETAPELNLPEYRGLSAKREKRSVSDKDIEHAIQLLAQRGSTFNTVDRELRQGDIAVVNYTGTTEGKPITEVAPTARGLTDQKLFWVEAKQDSFIPGFAMQLIGAKAGEKRTVNVDFPADFVTPQLAGKKGTYEVEVVEVKEQVVPQIDDAFAKTFGADTLQDLREGVRRDLQNELNTKQARSVRGQVVQALLSQITIELPESLVADETRNVVYQIVQENKERGIGEDVISGQKEQIYEASKATAKERVKASFVFQKIAEKEGIRVSPEEVNARIYTMARQYNMPAEKLAKELDKRNGIQDIWSQLLNEKVIDFLQQNARIEDVEATEAKS